MRTLLKILYVITVGFLFVSCGSASRKSSPNEKSKVSENFYNQKDKLDFKNIKALNSEKNNKYRFQQKRYLAEDNLGEVTRSQIATSNGLIAMLPTQNLRNAVSEYLNMIGLQEYENDDFGEKNSGIVAYNIKLMKENPCFSKLVSYYYFNVFKNNIEYMKNYSLNPTYLFENLKSSTVNQNIPSGWIWDLANEITKNDKNLSMNLIGICGHDNTNQLDKSEICKHGANWSICESASNNLPFYNQDHKVKYLDLLNKYEKIIKEKWQPDNDHQEFLKSIVFDEDFLEEMAGGLSCPFVGPFYLQGSLSEKSILDPNLVNEIAAIQAPNKGAAYLPSKYYHTIGAALTSCSLVRNGVPQFLIRKIQSVAINTYRMNRLCEKHTFNTEYNLNMSLAEIINFVKEFRINESLCIVGQYDDGNKKYDYNKPICNFLMDFDLLVTGPNIDYLELEKKIERRLHEPIANRMFTENITKEQCLSPQLTYEHIEKIRHISENESFCGRNVSTDSCKIARDILKTWWIDFKWSEAQQMKGVEFATENCKSESNYLNSNLEQRSCDILTTLK